MQCRMYVWTDAVCIVRNVYRGRVKTKCMKDMPLGCGGSVQAVGHGDLCVSVSGYVPVHSETDMGCEVEGVSGAVRHRWCKRCTRGMRRSVGSYGA